MQNTYLQWICLEENSLDRAWQKDCAYPDQIESVWFRAVGSSRLRGDLWIVREWYLCQETAVRNSRVGEISPRNPQRCLTQNLDRHPSNGSNLELLKLLCLCIVYLFVFSSKPSKPLELMPVTKCSQKMSQEAERWREKQVTHLSSSLRASYTDTALC